MKKSQESFDDLSAFEKGSTEISDQLKSIFHGIDRLLKHFMSFRDCRDELCHKYEPVSVVGPIIAL